jgi:hypothetical protein
MTKWPFWLVTKKGIFWSKCPMKRVMIYRSQLTIFDNHILIQTTMLVVHCYGKNETRNSTIAQGICANV